MLLIMKLSYCTVYIAVMGKIVKKVSNIYRQSKTNVKPGKYDEITHFCTVHIKIL